MSQSYLPSDSDQRVARAVLVALHAAVEGADTLRLDRIILEGDPTPRSLDEMILRLAAMPKPIWCQGRAQRDTLILRCAAIDGHRTQSHPWTLATWQASRAVHLLGTREGWLSTFRGSPSFYLLLLSGVGYQQCLTVEETVLWANDYDISTVGLWAVAADAGERARGIGAVVEFEGPRQIVEL